MVRVENYAGQIHKKREALTKISNAGGCACDENAEDFICHKDYLQHQIGNVDDR
jgi:hypothetical protein